MRISAAPKPMPNIKYEDIEEDAPKPKDDARYLQPGEAGDCTDIAYTKHVELRKRGIDSTMMACRLKDGQGHAFLLTDEGVLDNRFDRIIRYSEIRCE